MNKRQSHSTFSSALETRLLRRKAPCFHLMRSIARFANIVIKKDKQVTFETTDNRAIDIHLYMGGFAMEKATESMAVAKEELLDTREQLQTTLNDITVMCDRIQDMMKDQIEEIRGTRFTLVTETAQMMESLREVRKFFLDSQHQEEIQKLRAFVALCQDLRLFTSDGSLDTIIDSMLKLAVRQPS